MLQATVDRLTPLTGPGGVLVVTGAAHEPAVRAQLPELGAGAVLAEPSPRDSMAAIGLAAAVLAEREGDVVLGSFAADHVVRGDGFARAVALGVEAARAGFVATIGIAATAPSTAFGYIETGAPLADVPGAFHVEAFTEKPDADTAAAWLATGRYRWNAGMFLVRTEVLLGHLARLLPALHDGLRTIARAWDTPRARRGARVGLAGPAADRDRPRDRRARRGGRWRGGGAGGLRRGTTSATWRRCGTCCPATRTCSATRRTCSPWTRRAALVVPASGRLVALLGVPDLVVMDTADALLVTTRAQAQRVKAVVDALRERGRTDLL